MAFKFQIIDTALVVTNTVTGDIALDIPKRDTYYYHPSLVNHAQIKIIDTNAASAKGAARFGCDLTDAIDVFGVSFSEDSWIEFARMNLGRNAAQDYGQSVANGSVPNQSIYYKYGASSDIDKSATPVDVWNVAGEYTGFNAVNGQSISLSCSGTGAANNTGLVLSSGVMTGGDENKIQDTGANFIADGVLVGDLVINDTKVTHGIVTGVAATSLLILRMNNGSANESGNSYRVATSTSSGASVAKIIKALESDYDGYKSEYIVLNGTNIVNTVGTDYLRCSRGQIIMAGSSGTIEGELKANQSTTTANVFWLLEEGHDQTLVACDTIPKGHTLFIHKAKCNMSRSNGSAGSAEVEFKVRDFGEIFVSKIHQYISNSNGYESDTISVINEYADIKWRVQDVSDNNTQVAATISGILQKNT